MGDGTVVYRPDDVHRCVVQFHYLDNGAGTISLDHPAFWAMPGTVIACDCGRTFVAQDWRVGEMYPRWRPEGWWARRRRTRRAARAQ